MSVQEISKKTEVTEEEIDTALNIQNSYRQVKRVNTIERRRDEMRCVIKALKNVWSKEL